ncbi:ATP-binding protein [Agreia sp. VKM Ac-1783]|uniref:AlbA family DNA-binding domain-containing protein n=1 Tax=Agreia sp. VKM Ac-1783 TaxID=1938889 RepID=UPI000A2AB888|nr:ATP-binding protein [Agreia sp. VKM Ac-1783]SMQ68374.1 Putative DNA-binding domain-containing protein [Agreia sp. VKM Ac-1783]
MLTDDELRVILEIGGERRHVEFKRGGSLNDKGYVAKVVKACLSIANNRGGGHVVLGIDDTDPVGGLNGLTPSQLSEWTVFDNVTAKVNAYADPALEMTIGTLSHPSGGQVIALRIEEFGAYPVVCKKEFDGVLAVGQLYTRSSAKPESSARQTHAEMRELIELAVDKNLAQFLRRAQGGGLEFRENGNTLVPKGYTAQVDKVFLRQRDRVPEPYFRVIISGGSFREDRFDIPTLRARVDRSEVRHAGRAFPHMAFTGQGQDWVSGSTNEGAYLPETWTTFQSGLFVGSMGIIRAVKDRRLILADGQADPNFISVEEVVADFTMWLEFAARYMEAEKDARSPETLNSPGPEYVVSIEAHGIKDWALAAGQSQGHAGGFWVPYTYSDNVLRLPDIVMWPGTSIEESRAAALSAASKFFQYFGWRGATPELLAPTQKAILE